MEQRTPLEQAIFAAGSQAALASAIGVSQQAISYWIKKGGRVPAEMVLAVERASGISRFMLRPDMFDVPPAPASEAAA